MAHASTSLNDGWPITISNFYPQTRLSSQPGISLRNHSIVVDGIPVIRAGCKIVDKFHGRCPDFSYFYIFGESFQRFINNSRIHFRILPALCRKAALVGSPVVMIETSIAGEPKEKRSQSNNTAEPSSRKPQLPGLGSAEIGPCGSKRSCAFSCQSRRTGASRIESRSSIVTTFPVMASFQEGR